MQEGLSVQFKRMSKRNNTHYAGCQMAANGNHQMREMRTVDLVLNTLPAKTRSQKSCLTSMNEIRLPFYSTDTMSERVRNDEMPKLDLRDVKSNLDALTAIFAKSGKVEMYSVLAGKLSAITHKENPWTWRYVQSVHTGSIAPSETFSNAVDVLMASLDGLPTFIAETEPITVYARPGAIHPNAIVLSESKPCSEPTCTIHFVPRVPWQKYCPMHKNKKDRTQ